MGSFKARDRRQNLQQQLADKDNAAVDGRKHAVMPPDRFRATTPNSPPLPSPSRGFPGFGSTGAGSPSQQPQQQTTSATSREKPERPQPPRRIQLGQPVWGSCEQNYQ